MSSVGGSGPTVELRPGGQAVDARGVAREVIRRMGLDTAVRKVRTRRPAREIGRLHVHSRDASSQDEEPDMEALMALVDRAINGVELPDYAGVPDSGVVPVQAGVSGGS